MKSLDQRVRYVDLHSGERLAIVDTEIPDDAPVALRESLARRAIVNSGGTCPCGAKFAMPSREVRRLATKKGLAIEITVEHAEGCPASSDVMVTAFRSWTGGAE